MSKDSVSIEAGGRRYVVSVHEDMLNDLPPAMQVVYADWLSGFTRGRYGEQEAAIRLAMIFTNVGRGHRLDSSRWTTYGFGVDELREFVNAGVAIMDSLYPGDAEPDEDEGEGGSGND